MLRLRCKVSSLDELKSIDLAAYNLYGRLEGDTSYEFLYKGVDYLVYGLLMTNKGLYVMTSEEKESYMRIIPLAMFDIIDYEMPSVWKMYAGDVFNGWGNVYWYYTFEEWSAEPNLFEKLVDGDTDAECVFERIKKKYY